MKKFNLEKTMFKFVIIGALNWGLIGLFNFNLVKYINDKMFDNDTFSKIIYVLVGVSAISLFRRDVFLPFLGKAVYPCGALEDNHPKEFDSKVEIKVKPNSNVIYWASEKNAKITSNPWDAYGEYNNSGVARSDSTGKAVLKFTYPGQYRVPYKGLLPPHVHYRVCLGNGMMSRIETINLRKKK